MRNRRGSKALFFAMVAGEIGLLMVFVPGRAHAQAAAGTAVKPKASGYEIEEITVTARKREEKLIDVPVAVTAVGGAEIARFEQTKIENVVSHVPTLNVQVGGSGSGAQISLRGVGSSNISAAFDSAVALDIDGVSVSSMRILRSSFLDLAQMAVLKGPQSLYFGKSASAGVLSLTSADPTDTWKAALKPSYEFEQRGYTLESYVSGPITDKLGIRIAARFNDIAEQSRNIVPHVAAADRAERNINARGTIKWHPWNSFRANLKFNYVGLKSDSDIRNSVNDCGKNGVADPVFLLSGARVIPAGYRCDQPWDVVYIPDSAPPLAKKAPFGIDNHHGASFDESDLYFTRLKLDWDPIEWLTATSVTGYVNQDSAGQGAYSYGGAAPDGTSYGAGTGLVENDLEQITQEVRIASNLDGRFNFMLGAFYEHRKIDFNTAQEAVNISLLAPDPVTGYTFDWYKKHATKADAYSVFGSLTFDITKKLELTGGARWTREEKTNTIDVPYVHSLLSSGPAFIKSGFNSGPIEFNDSNISPEVSLQYKATPDLNLYVAYKTGYKSGGIDNSALPSSNLLGMNDPLRRPGVIKGLVYGSETSEGGEAGLKTRLFDGRLTLNAAAFYYIFSDLQVQNFNAVTIQFLTSNAGELATRGFDVDFDWRTPVEGLGISGALAFTNAEFTESFVPDPSTGIDIKGRAPSRAPEWAGNISPGWRVPVGNAYEFDLTGNVSFSSDYFGYNAKPDDYVQPAFATVDMAASFGQLGKGWQVAVIGSNLSEERVVTSSGPRPFLKAGVGDDIILSLTEGRKVFLQLSYTY